MLLTSPLDQIHTVLFKNNKMRDSAQCDGRLPLYYWRQTFVAICKIFHDNRDRSGTSLNDTIKSAEP